MSSSSCHSVSSATISQCLDTLVEHSELPDNDVPSKRTIRSNDVLSPWSHQAAPSNAQGNKPRRKREKTSPSLPRRAASASTARNDDPVRNTISVQAKKKSAKFRGFLNTLWCSERPSVEPSFQHLSDVGEYIEHYRAAHQQPANAVTVNSGRENRRPHTHPGSNNVKSTARENAGETAKKCSRAERGCPHYTPRSPCIRNYQSDTASRPPHSAPRVTNTSKMAVTGKRLESGKNNVQGERGRNTFRFGKSQRVIVAESPKCKRIYLTWRQYLKYFSKPAPRHHDQNEVDGGEKDSNGGYTERPATPHHPVPPRAATCVPVLDYDQSRVGTPVSPFRIDQSARSRHARSATSIPDRRSPRDLDYDRSLGGTPVSPIRVDQSARSTHVRSATSTRDRRNTVGLSERDILMPWQRPSSEKRRQVCTAAGRVNATRTRLAICTVIDIQAAIRELAMSLGTKKPLVVRHMSDD